MDIENTVFGTLIIDGTLLITNEYQTVNIVATNIWIRGGTLKVGDEDEAYTG